MRRSVQVACRSLAARCGVVSFMKLMGRADAGRRRVSTTTASARESVWSPSAPPTWRRSDRYSSADPPSAATGRALMGRQLALPSSLASRPWASSSARGDRHERPNGSSLR